MAGRQRKNVNGAQKYPHLFEPIILGDQVFRNRIFASPTGHQDLTLEGFTTPASWAYYERKARGGAASVAVGECVVSEAAKGADWHIVMDNRLAYHSLRSLTDAVTKHGAVVSAELVHWGRYANCLPGNPRPAYGPMECDITSPPARKKHVRAYTDEMIEEVIEQFANAAAFAKQCGFTMVTIHGAHGWLIPQFVSPYTNTRTDKWGGTFEKRMRLPLAICDAMRKRLGKGFPIEFRMSGSESMENGYDIDYGVKIARALDGHVDLIHVSAGHHMDEDAFSVMCPSMFRDDECNVTFAAEIKKHVRTPVATVGAINDPGRMEEILAAGQADIIELGRAILSDPDLPNKIREGREDEIRRCMRCMSCFSSLILNGQYWCAINPRTGRELDYKYEIPRPEPKKVLVVGGGVGGMEAALACAERGHQVILCEKADRLGGSLLCEEKVPFKKHTIDYLRFQARSVTRNKRIEVRLKTEVTRESATSMGVDAIICSIGAGPIVPEIPGIEKALSAEQVLRDIDKAGKKVVIIGAGLAGCELGIYLAMSGREVKIVEMTDRINDGGNFLHVQCMGTFLRKYGVDIKFDTKAVEVAGKSIVCHGPGGVTTFEADTVVYAVGQKPLRDEAFALSSCARRFYQIGDCNVPRNIAAATNAAFATAQDIGT
jgi:2,4-dienoyl-CoA reductase-like NADH-dependent reductase (Old Yellow Enzyme family)/thioredoxin reductase